MKAFPALTLLALVSGSYSAAAQLTPTEELAAERQHQQQQQQAQQNAPRVQTSRLTAPCVVPQDYYPLRTCAVSFSGEECARGWNAWPTFAQCCYPSTQGAFPQGCTDPNVEETCFVAGGYFPSRTCQETNNLTQCSFNWGHWPSEAECCAPGSAFTEGCTQQKPCWAAATWSPDRTCASTSDVDTCTRGWGTWETEAECCAAGNAFSNGCGQGLPPVDGVVAPANPEMPAVDDPFATSSAVSAAVSVAVSAFAVSAAEGPAEPFPSGP